MTASSRVGLQHGELGMCVFANSNTACALEKLDSTALSSIQQQQSCVCVCVCLRLYQLVNVCVRNDVCVVCTMMCVLCADDEG